MNMIRIKGEKFVLLPVTEYEQLKASAAGLKEKDLPALPKADANGNRPAVEYARVTLAIKIITARRTAGLTQGELATLAGVRLETINRLERAKHSADSKTIDKIEAALSEHTHRRKTRRAG